MIHGTPEISIFGQDKHKMRSELMDINKVTSKFILVKLFDFRGTQGEDSV